MTGSTELWEIRKQAGVGGGETASVFGGGTSCGLERVLAEVCTEHGAGCGGSRGRAEDIAPLVESDNQG